MGLYAGHLEFTALHICGTIDDRSQATSSDNAPDEECDTRSRGNEGFGREEVAELVHREVQERKGS